MKDDAVAKVIALVAEQLELPVGKVNAKSSIDSLPEWDSEAHMNICLAFEERFGVTMDMDTIGDVTSVAALASLLERAGQKL